MPQDHTEAVKWWRLAAEQGDAAAQNNLGAMYARGRGVPQNDAEAAKWIRMAAEQGYASAQNILGLMYINGEGVPQNYVSAYMWFTLAAAQGFEETQKAQNALAGEMKSDQVAEAQRMAREWMARHQQ